MAANNNFSLNIVFISLVASLSGFLSGYHTGIMTGALLFISEQFHLTAIEQGMAVSIILIGGLAGALFGGALSDYLGRRRAFFFTVLLALAATLFLSAAQSFSFVMFGRFIAGLAIGIGSVVAPLYIAETAPAARRGALVSLYQLMIVTGILVAFWVSYLFAGAADWRTMFMIGAIPAAIQWIGLFFIPESPAWPISRTNDSKKTEKEQGVRAMLYPNNMKNRLFGLAKAPIIDDRKLVRIGLILTNLRSSIIGSFRSSQKADFSCCLGIDPAARPAFLVGIGISLFQQMTGINTVFYYAPHIFKCAGCASAESAIFATLWVGIVNVFMTLIGLWLIDKAGRRPLLLASLSGMTVSLGLLGAAFVFDPHGGSLAVISLMVYISSFAIGMGTVPWLIISEIFPLEIRGRAMGISVFSNWTANYLIALSFPPLVHAIGIGPAYWLFTIVCIAGVWFFWKKMPETRGKTFEEIRMFWHK